MKSTRYYYPILMKHELAQQIFEKYSNIQFMKNLSSGSRVFLCRGTYGDGQTDMTKPIVTFLNFTIAPGKSARENVQREIVQELNFPELTVQYVIWKIKTLGIRYATELARVIKSEKVVQVYTTFTCRNCCGSNKHIHPCLVFLYSTNVTVN